MSDGRIIDSQIKEGTRFKAPDSDVTFIARKPDPKIPGNWLVTQHFTGGPIRGGGGGAHKLQERLFSKPVQELIEMHAMHAADVAVRDMNTQGLAKSKQFEKRRGAKHVSRLQMIREAHQRHQVSLGAACHA